MTTIYQRIENKLVKIYEKSKEDAKKELIHQRVEEIYRGKSFLEKIKGVIRIFS